MALRYRPMLEVLREALRTLQDDPGPMTPEKRQLVRYLRERILANSDSQALGNCAE